MWQLIDDLFSFSKLSHTNEVMEEVDLNTVVQQILNYLEILIKEMEAEIVFQQLPTIKGTHFQLGQVFQNLISNSLKFSHTDRKPRISIECERVEKEGKYYKITYQDNGIGFKHEQASRIFEVFHRLPNKDQYEGTGVGLAIVKKIIDQHHGTIGANGIENIGATFEICLTGDNVK